MKYLNTTNNTNSNDAFKNRSGPDERTPLLNGDITRVESENKGIIRGEDIDEEAAGVVDYKSFPSKAEQPTRNIASVISILLIGKKNSIRQYQLSGY